VVDEILAISKMTAAHCGRATLACERAKEKREVERERGTN